jgi:hypothetical protein
MSSVYKSKSLIFLTEFTLGVDRNFGITAGRYNYETRRKSNGTIQWLVC